MSPTPCACCWLISQEPLYPVWQRKKRKPHGAQSLCLPMAGSAPTAVQPQEGQWHGSSLLPLTCCVAWGQFLALSVACFLVWEAGSSQCQPPHLCTSHVRPTQASALGPWHPPQFLVKESRPPTPPKKESRPSPRRWRGQRLPGPEQNWTCLWLLPSISPQMPLPDPTLGLLHP